MYNQNVTRKLILQLHVYDVMSLSAQFKNLGF